MWGNTRNLGLICVWFFVKLIPSFNWSEWVFVGLCDIVYISVHCNRDTDYLNLELFIGWLVNTKKSATDQYELQDSFPFKNVRTKTAFMIFADSYCTQNLTVSDVLSDINESCEYSVWTLKIISLKELFNKNSIYDFCR